MCGVSITISMASTRVEWFLAAKRCLRAHPDWTDQQVAEHCGIPVAMSDMVIAPARREVEQDGEMPGGPVIIRRGTDE